MDERLLLNIYKGPWCCLGWGEPSLITHLLNFAIGTYMDYCFGTREEDEIHCRKWNNLLLLLNCIFSDRTHV